MDPESAPGFAIEVDRRKSPILGLLLAVENSEADILLDVCYIPLFEEVGFGRARLVKF